MRGLSSKARRLVRLYGEAREADSWKGGGDPEDVPETEAYLRLRTTKLHEYIAELETVTERLRGLRDRVRPNSEVSAWVAAELDRILENKP